MVILSTITKAIASGDRPPLRAVTCWVKASKLPPLRLVSEVAATAVEVGVGPAGVGVGVGVGTSVVFGNGVGASATVVGIGVGHASRSIGSATSSTWLGLHPIRKNARIRSISRSKFEEPARPRAALFGT
jgi:hypothetical protein